MGWLAKAWSDERLDEVAADTYRLTVSRLISAAVVAVIMVFALGPAIAAAWLLSLYLGEGLALLVTRRFKAGRTGTPQERAWFAWSSIPINISWSTLAILLWLHSEDLMKIAAVAIWCGQVIYTQNFRHQSAPLLVLNGLAPMASLLIFPFFFMPDTGAAAQTARWGLVLLVGTTLNVMIQNRAAARRMDELTRSLREESEKALEAARAKSTFIAVTSHELRTPMNGLLGMAHALRRSTLDPVQREQVELMIKSGDGLMQLLNDVLDLSRVEAGRVELAPIDMSLQDLVGEVVDAWRDAAVFKNLTLTVDYAPDLPPGVHADPLRIRQVVTNLVSNAIKFTVDGGVRLEVSTTPGGQGAQGVSITVSDSGPGVPADAAERVFDSFTQADQTISREHGGAGLGLSIARSLARQMGGDLVLVPSERGACFNFTFVAPACAAPVSPAQDVEPRAEDLGQIQVLMAEDNAINQLVVRTMLEPLGVALTVVDNGQEALKAMGERRFDCVLMDINMPVMDGISALEAIRDGRTGNPAMPVIALTASAMSGDRERFLGLGFDDHLGKPVKPVDLITAIVNAVGPPPGEGRRAA
ncbi:hybrid sensor histidine kinase/response regulator [Caulobacter vibrioides]|uniref:histidine kinase n=1 Tax=Caulobacter vibrioides TaxID=155892 RepID=A0A290MYU8_CAUVI|nr:ATP-binding protein [Caulobacter vibrioides]ATC32804.1 hybrid sensor histidine kinase/response regulator [Caulobacter vibrioides]